MSATTTSPAITASSLRGTWSLRSWEVTLADGSKTFPFGEKPMGMISYSDAGTVHAHFSRSGRERLGLDFENIQALRRHLLGIDKTPPEDVDVDGCRDIFTRGALEFNGYCGFYSVEGDIVHHKVMTAVIPEWEGVVLKRRVQFEADDLILSTDNQSQQDRLIWRRMSKKE